MAKIINGKEMAAQIRAEAALEAAQFARRYGRAPGLAVIIVGSDPASQIYVRNKHKACAACGISSQVIELPGDTGEKELLARVAALNEDAQTDGILVQLPLPEGIDKRKVISAVAPAKDVDVFHSLNVGMLTSGDYTLAPCTPSGVLEMLRRTGIVMEGRKCVMVGRSNLVGKPLALLMLEQNCTLTVCHSKTVDLKKECRQADILISAVGKPRLITGDMVKKGAVVIDIGINRLEDGSLCGDVDFEAAKKKASYITPVPGGVGPMTVAMLMKNTVRAAFAAMEKKEK
ncbi:MAG: bifunctional methylenetetrahydrofolate dehydrogenase/methenyltetrahydrofolate cyclohydrolase FolD [Clostridia bacterium]|nr:bifunctional methylenetetrahydrofolate dehydrogenase/methenyltetrahydrofolate cyclohydrolase FolD [Clostridia bacterium]